MVSKVPPSGDDLDVDNDQDEDSDDIPAVVSQLGSLEDEASDGQ